MSSNIVKASKSDFDAVQNFYYTIIDEMRDSEFRPLWEKGVYPADEDLRDALDHGELYVHMTDGEITGAMRVNHSAADGYNTVHWEVDAAPGEVTVIHMLGVSCKLQGTGVSGKMVDFVINKARTEGQKAVRLDVLKGNLPALRLYEKAGFKFIEEIQLFYDDTGLTEFEVYEYAL